MFNQYEITEYAYKSVPFYREILKNKAISFKNFSIKDNWCDIPIIEKKEVAQKNNQLIADKYMGLYALNKLLKTHTSGSSGMQIDVYWDNKDFNFSLLPLWMERWRQAEIKPKDRVCYFNTILEDESVYIYDKNALIVSKRNLTFDKFVEMANVINKFQPKWLLVHPTMALWFCRLIEEEKIAFPSVQYIELTGEIILDSLVIRLKENFNCVVKGHYGSMEVNSIGYQISGNDYSLFEDATYVEIVDDCGNLLPYDVEGNVCVTSLHNKAMPIIRYKLGDMGILKKTINNGRECRILHLSHARNDDFIHLKDGTQVEASLLLNPIMWLSTRGEKVVFQIIAKQVSLTQLSIAFYLDQEIDCNEFLQVYISHLDECLLSNFDFSFSFMKEMLEPNQATGKVKWFEGLKRG